MKETMVNQKVSVLISAYNAEHYIEAAVNSIRQQTWKQLEIIICDDCSQDKTWTILERIAKEDSRIKLLKNEKNSFAAYSRNRCLEIAEGEFIAIQDADDISALNRIETLVKALQEHEEYDFISCAEALFTNDPSNIYRTVDHKPFPQKKDFLRGMCFCHAATLFRRRALVSVGGYPIDKKIQRHEDYMMFMNLYAQGYRGMNLTDCLYFYRVDKQAMRRRKFKARIEECKIRYRGFKKMKLLPIGIPFIFVPIVGYVLQKLGRK